MTIPCLTLTWSFLLTLFQGLRSFETGTVSGLNQKRNPILFLSLRSIFSNRLLGNDLAVTFVIREEPASQFKFAIVG